MARFFVDALPGGDDVSGLYITIAGDDARHMAKSLRMKPGERLTVCDGSGMECLCEFCSATGDEAQVRVLERRQCESEPRTRVTLYQGYPKGDKLEFVIEKAVELGAWAVVPVLTARSVARPERSAAEKKLVRWQRHALEAAKQCGRGIVPEVEPMTEFRQLGEKLRRHDAVIFCYELGGVPMSEAAEWGKARDIGIFIGPEGGIAEEEARSLTEWGAKAVTLGKRILRCETAPLAAITAAMLLSGELN